VLFSIEFGLAPKGCFGCDWERYFFLIRRCVQEWDVKRLASVETSARRQFRIVWGTTLLAAASEVHRLKIPRIW